MQAVWTFSSLMASAEMKNDSVSTMATVNYIPIYHYLLDRRPVRIEESGLIIYSRTNSKHPKWPEVEDAYTPFDSVAFQHINLILDQADSEVVMDNGCYVLIKPNWNLD